MRPWFHRRVKNIPTESHTQLKNMASKSKKSSQTLTEISEQSPKSKRGNIVMSAMVELGLRLMKYKRASEVARFMAAAGVPVRVITRVLLRPDLRRNMKRQHFA